MECNVCESRGAEVTDLGYANGDTHEMYLCDGCRRRFVLDRTVHSVGRFEVS